MKKVILMFFVAFTLASFSSCKKELFNCTCYNSGSGAVLWEAEVEATSKAKAEQDLTKTGGDCENDVAKCVQE